MKRISNDKILGIVIVCIFATLLFEVFSLVTNSETITIQGEVVNAETHLNDGGGVEYITLYFSDGQSYNVTVFEEYTDFTVNSEIILELFKGKGFLLPEFEHWRVQRIIKVPKVE